MNEAAAATVWYMPALTWWPFVVLAGALALPLTARLFRGLPDRGGAIAPVVGLAFVLYASWIPAIRAPPYFFGRGTVQAACLCAAALFVVRARFAIRAHPLLSRDRLWRFAAFWPATLFALMAVLPLPRSAAGIWFVVLLLAATSFAAYAEGPDRARSSLSRAALPFLASQAIALAGFVAFCFVRSYLPWAHHGVEHSGAEKFGNLMHLSSAMRSATLPPADAWFSGLPTNYYYGGHLLVATIARATGPATGAAFNLGLATVFALTLGGAFGFALGATSLAATRRLGRLAAPRNAGWAALGAVAVAVFGNLDAIVQYREHGWSFAGLRNFDFWRSSRVIHGAPEFTPQPGTITEFPFFSAILGDLHPHHMAVPFALLVLCAFVNLHRLGSRARTWQAWTKRCGGALVLLGAAIGIVYSVNIWDSVVFGPMALLAIWFGARHVEWPQAASRPLAFFAALVAATWCVALLWNSTRGAIPLFGSAIAHAAAIALAVAAILVRERLPTLLPGLLAGAGTMIFAGGFGTGRGVPDPDSWLRLALAIGCRDTAVFSAVLFLVWRSALAKDIRFGGVPVVTALWVATGAVALAVTVVFAPWFQSPLQASGPILLSAFPPVPASDLFTSPAGVLSELQRRSIVTTFPDELRTHPGELLIYWGVFLVPIALVLLVRAGALAGSARNGVAFGAAGLLAGAMVFLRNELETWTASLALAWMAGCLIVAGRRVRSADGILWPLLAGVGAAVIFVETLHFDDSYAGYLERYNTPFKVLYPLWPILAVGMVVALRQLAAWLPRGLRRNRIATACAVAMIVLPFAIAGLVYPASAVFVRTRGFGAYEGNTALERGHPRSLDATEWLLHTGDHSDAADHAVAEWLRANANPGEHVLECPPPPDAESYSYYGRISAVSGVPAPIGWPHHQRQWRGWTRAVPEAVAVRFAPILPESAFAIPALPSDIDGALAGRSDRLALKIVATVPPPERDEEAAWQLPLLSAEQRSLLLRRFAESGAGPPSSLDVIAQLVADMEAIYSAPSFTPDVRLTLALHHIRYVVVGGPERARFAEGLAKFEALEPLFASGDTTLYRVPDDFLPRVAEP